MRIQTCYKAKITESHGAFRDTVALYRDVIDFLIDVILLHWVELELLKKKKRVNRVEQLIHKTKKRPVVEFPEFGERFPKLPSYLRRAAIAEALGKVQAYKSSYERWGKMGGKKNPPADPHAGFAFLPLYSSNMFKRVDAYHAEIKVFKNNDWVWHLVKLRKSDMDYIERHCANRKMQSPTLTKRGKNWYLDFPFKEYVALKKTKLPQCRVLSIDLGLNCSAACVVMSSNGTVIARRFLRQAQDNDLLSHALSHVKKSQAKGSRSMPAIWGAVKAINKRISMQTAEFIVAVAKEFDVDVIVFEHLNVRGKKRKWHGKKKSSSQSKKHKGRGKKNSSSQRVHHWRCQYVQAMVTNKAHRNRMRVSRVCAKNTSRLAFDGSGSVQRGKEANLPTNSLCRFKDGRVYNCDLNAAYNIGARYFVREYLKTFSDSETERRAVEAKVPALSKRSTVTLSDLISLQAVLGV
ncbi:MAG: hypothetical protein IKZ87_08765 [Actinomycetaceae bacterium]|nr:hypothetical protein [Actinomycetaceae bacterium]